MEQIGKLVKERADIILEGFDPIVSMGFTQVPNVVLKDKGISFAGKLTYAMLLSYHWYNRDVFPGQDRLANDLGVSMRTVNRAIRELVRVGYLKVKRIGLGKTNRYHLFKTVQNRS